MTRNEASAPYCGAPPIPGELWSRWIFDPIVIAALLLAAGLYGLGAGGTERKGTGQSAREQAAFYGGWAIASLALISPLCALSVSLFCARVAQHVILALVAAPLIAAGRPGIAYARIWFGDNANVARRRRGISAGPLTAAAAFAAILWFWHAPTPYGWTFEGSLAYWSMHLSLFASALWLWSALLDRQARGPVTRLGAGLLSALQIGLLGAHIALAPRPLFPPQASTSAAWGLTPLQDQMLGGGIMGISGMAAFLALCLWSLRQLWASSHRRPEPSLLLAAARGPIVPLGDGAPLL